MVKSKYNVVGVMSGTSLDGIDLAYVRFVNNGHWTFEVVVAETIPYSGSWEHRLRHCITYEKKELEALDEEYSLFLSNIIRDFIQRHDLKETDAVCSHGHTVFHQPEKGLTYQIGNRPSLAQGLNCTVVCDFRVQDVALGGQGAPLVPIGDELLFSDYDYCLNLGGFANVSSALNGKRIAFDICPVNIVLNHYVNKLNLPFDDKGEIAARGKVHPLLLEELNALEFYSLTYPKSLGLEWVRKEVFPLIDSFELGVEDVLRTFIEHIAIQISREVKSGHTLLVTGGGAYNDFLIGRLRELSGAEVIVPAAGIVEFKEALVFAFLGVLRLRDEVNCLMSVTGATKDHSSGIIFNS